MFSARVPRDLAPNRLTRAIRRLQDAGTPVADLTESNPTSVGLRYPEDWLAPLADPASLVHDPRPFGLPAAREAVAAHLRRQGGAITADRIVLTAGTSEAYSILFKLLCDPGDDVLVPRPGYPLFDHLTWLEGLENRRYGLVHETRWKLDLDDLAGATSPRTRAVLVVSPNNPTGSYLTLEELGAVAAFCARRSLALIGDEVFRPYPRMTIDAPHPAVLEQRDALTFSLGGLSKSIGLPQLKLSWIAVGGPGALVDQALARLELICDSYLSVATPVQHAAAALLETGEAVRAQIHARIRRNVMALEQAAVQDPASRVLAPEGGWHAVIRTPAPSGEEARVLDLLERHHVLVHPGYYYDFPGEAYLVLSLLPEPDLFDRAVARLFAR